MINFEFSIPTIIHFGRDSHFETGRLLSKIGKNALILYGSERIVKSGLFDCIQNLLLNEGISCTPYGGVKPNPSIETAKEGIAICKRERIDCILAIGGGSVVDCAKAIALGAKSNQDPWDIYTGKIEAPQNSLPIGVIITIPATGSEANGVSVLSNYSKKDKRVIVSEACIPKFAILNPDITKGIPRYETSVAAMDIFSHCFERYFDLRRESRIWDSLCEATMKTMIELTPKLIRDLSNYELRSELMWIATVAHSNMLGTGGDFGCHSLAHAVTIQHKIPHGAALALVMPAWVTHMYQFSKDKFDSFGQCVWGVKNGIESIDALKKFIKSLGLPITLKETGVANACIDDLTKQAFSHGEAYLGGGFGKIYQADAEAIFRLLE